MSSHLNPPAASFSSALARLLRLGLRGIALTLYILAGVGVALLLRSGSRFADASLGVRFQDRVASLWARGFCRLYGLRIRRRGDAVAGALIVSNHLSWTDIMVILACTPARFVSKAEVQRWPLIGWLAAGFGTIFHRRGDRDSLSHVSKTIRSSLSSGAQVAIFPEGRTGDGIHLGAFHARLFQTAIDTHAPIQALALCYHGGAGNTEVCFHPNESFAGNLLRLLGYPSRQVDVHFGDCFRAEGRARRALAEQSRSFVLRVLGDQPCRNSHSRREWN